MLHAEVRDTINIKDDRAPHLRNIIRNISCIGIIQVHSMNIFKGMMLLGKVFSWVVLRFSFSNASNPEKLPGKLSILLNPSDSSFSFLRLPKLLGNVLNPDDSPLK